jgi:hypothetical protein
VLWVSWRLSRFLYYHLKDQWNGGFDLLTTLQYEFQYEDLFKDNEDMRIVNFRYGDHIDRAYTLSQLPMGQMFKPDADRAKAAVQWYRHGNNTFWDWMTKF